MFAVGRSLCGEALRLGVERRRIRGWSMVLAGLAQVVVGEEGVYQQQW